ncbi:MAG: TIGR03960 family B12-binding radical SAM protein [Desulfobacterales bacterium]|nr:TIGR03960 family B12-binding radical SAM protein [Desulfobacterales bacterium]
MNNNRIEDILPLVERPSRYLGSEVNSIHKDLAGIKLKIALAFPDMYEIGTSHFGLQILYHILNRQPQIAAERVFAPAPDMAALLKSSGAALQTLESGWPLRRFNIIGFSLLYELNYTNMLAMLDLAGIPFNADQRDLSYPLIIAGGPSMVNPEPVADFFDAILVGDGEEAVLEMAEAWLLWKEDGSGDKQTLLKMWSAIEGVYIPSFFSPVYDASGFQTLIARFPDYTKVRRAIVSDLDSAAFPQKPILPFGRPVHDRLRLEISRGCTRGCRFCQAGMTYRPVRERKTETLVALSEASLAATGYEDLSLLSLSTGDHSCIQALLQHLMDRCEQNHTAVSLPSIRAGTLTPELMKLIKRVRKTGFTIAPEAGSQRLRDVINKNILNDEIIRTVKDAFGLGWRVIKLYFMIGLPTETPGDLRELVELVKALRLIKSPTGAKLRKGAINVSITTFIPKPHTPFQWSTQLSLTESNEKIRMLKDQLHLSGIHFKWQNPEVSAIEGLWSRGDRRLSRLLTAAYRRGCRFDGWSDLFQFHSWQKAIEDAQVDADFYTTRTRDIDEPLPWDHIDCGPSKDYLKAEWQKALAAEPTPDCRKGACNSCGVCDFDRVAPIVFTSCPTPPALPAPAAPFEEPAFQTFQLTYAKKGPARYFGHLEMVNIFLRAIRRVNLPLKYSQGFHPMPKVSFEDPLPIGLESLAEIMSVTVRAPVKPDEIPTALNSHLPEGLEALGCRPAPAKADRAAIQSITYQLTLKEGSFDRAKLQYFNDKPEVILERLNRKGNRIQIDLKKTVVKVEFLSDVKLQLTLKSEPGKTIRPFEAVSEIFTITPEAIKLARCVKIVTN